MLESAGFKNAYSTSDIVRSRTKITVQRVTERGACTYMAVFRTERFRSHLQVMTQRMNM